MNYQKPKESLEAESKSDILYLCKCMCPVLSSDHIVIPEHKKRILNNVARTESYLRERRIPELIRFLLTKVLAQQADKPILYLEKLLDDCMLFRASVGAAPVLFENRHVEAVIKSFDPGQRGWLTVGQVRRLYATLVLPLKDELQERMPCSEIYKNVTKAQENELYSLLSAGMNKSLLDE